MFLIICCVALYCLPGVRAEGWDDFSNNLATDLAPFLSLFGEQITKQYLSESITYLDYFIFAMAPMGILTAVVSAIRVCGSPSLRAFIGRAQEGAGFAEAELCSSTSRDVCELYNAGGIARVFGRPKILEIVVKRPSKQPYTDEDAELYTFNEYISKHGGDQEWQEEKGKAGRNVDAENPTEPFAPNLSLNIGIKRQHPAVFLAVAILGVVLQLGVLLFAVIVTYYLRWKKGDSAPDPYACPLTLIGTLSVCGGIYFCAFLVGQSTDEKFYRRNPQQNSGLSTIYWIQPGGQVLGDQTFDAFCWNDSAQPLQDYVTSWKNQQKKPSVRLWVAVILTISGFVLQFIGLRGLHSSVSVSQLGAIMVMSMLRAALRMQRLKPSHNALANRPDEIVGHELDWLALQIAKQDVQNDLRHLTPSGISVAYVSWDFCGVTDAGKRIVEEPPSTRNSVSIHKVLKYRSRLAQLTESTTRQRGVVVGARNFGVEMVEGRVEAQRLRLAMESTLNMIFSKTTVQRKWRNSHHLYLGFKCAVSYELYRDSEDTTGILKPDEIQNGAIHSTMYLRLSRRNMDAPWRLCDGAELEGLLGLSVWSMKSDPTVEVRDPQSDFIQSKAAEIPVSRIVSDNSEVARTDLRLWLAGTALNINESNLQVEPRSSQEPRTVWTTSNGKTYKPIPIGFPENSESKQIRFIGWYAIDIPHTDPPKELRVWSIPTKRSLVLLSAQELFGSFFKSVLDIVEDIGEIEISEKPYFQLENALVTEAAAIFMDNQLGTRDEARLCIVPALLSRLQVTSTEGALATAKASADQHRRRREWNDAEAILKWVWSLSMRPQGSANQGTIESTKLQEHATIALGELYLWALRDTEANNFGCVGIQWLFEQAFDRGAEHKFLTTIASRYHKVREETTKETFSDHGGILPSIQSGDLVATLVYLTRASPKLSQEKKGEALCLAARQGWSEVVSTLLELGVNANYQDAKSLPALSHAAQVGNHEIATLLVNAGASPNLEDNKDRTALSHASEMGHCAVIKMLLNTLRTSPNQKDYRGQTPISWAAAKGQEESVRTLASLGAVVDLEDTDFRTPLSHAAENGHDAVIRILVELGAVTERKDASGRTPLSWASANGHETTVRELVNLGAGVNIMDASGQTPLSWAAINGQDAVVRVLLDLGAEVDTTDNNGRTPLSWAAGNGQDLFIRALAGLGADLDSHDDVYDITPLTWAVRQGHDGTFTLLKELGARDRGQFRPD